MISKGTSYKIFRVLWLYLLIVNIADLRLHTAIDILPFIHLSEIPFVKYLPFVLALFLLIPFKEFISVLKQKENLIVVSVTGILLLVSFISAVYSVFPENSLRVTSRYVSYYIFLILSVASVSYYKQAPSFIIRSYIYINCIVIAGSLLDYYVYDFHLLLVRHFDRPEAHHSVLKIGSHEFMRPMGFLTDTNLAAFSIGLSLILLIINYKEFSRVFTYTFFIAGSYVFGMLASRASLIICIIALMYFFIAGTIGRKQAIIFAVLFVVFQCITPHTYSRILSLSENNGLEEKEVSFGRIIIWKAAWDVFEENPVLGAGPGNFFELSQVKIREVIFTENPGIDIDNPQSKDYYTVGKGNPHNLFLAVLTEAGILGFIIFISLIVVLLYFFVKTKRWLSLLILGLVLLVSFVSNFAPYYKFYLLICIICYVSSKSNMKIRNELEKG